MTGLLSNPAVVPHLAEVPGLDLDIAAKSQRIPFLSDRGRWALELVRCEKFPVGNQ